MKDIDDYERAIKAKMEDDLEKQRLIHRAEEFGVDPEIYACYEEDVHRRPGVTLKGGGDKEKKDKKALMQKPTTWNLFKKLLK